MTNARLVERAIYQCREVDCEDYDEFPGASEEEYAYMMAEAADTSRTYIFPYIRKCEAKKYIEFYIYDVMLYPANCFRRFIIYDGCRMTEDDEDDFMKYISDTNMRGMDRIADMASEADEVFPEWHLKRYPGSYLKWYLQQMYYSSNPGPREILFKAGGLSNIAHVLDDIPWYNVIGNSPEDILDAPLKLLRILNQNSLLKEYIFDKEKFGLAVSVYKEYSNYIGKEIPNCVQFKYLEQLYLNDNFAGHAFMRPLYNRLEGTNVHILEDYKYFFEFREKLSGILSKELKTAIKMRLPKSDDVSFEVCKMHTLLECLEEGGEEDRLIKERKALGTYEYEGDKYIVVLPASAWDFCMEAYNQGNCLWDSYYKKHAYGKTTILFVRKKDNPDKSFVTIEVKDYIINEVRGKYNCIPPKEVILFLKEYAKRNWLFFDVFNYALHAVDDEEPVSKDFLEFFETLEAKDKEYWRAMCGNCGLDNVEFKQLRIPECFPGEPENDEPIKGCNPIFGSCCYIPIACHQSEF